jgi:hypothetical protein
MSRDQRDVGYTSFDWKNPVQNETAKNEHEIYNIYNPEPVNIGWEKLFAPLE